ncbi:MAG: SMC-Scp complex subunit ScpB [Oscillospiraceae bacterium]|nr:SMC-Scp complex subunit ScpB [Oscillospiraceae bacterium]
MTELKSTLEAVLFAAGEAVPVARLSLTLAAAEDDVLAAAEELMREYEENRRGIRLLQLNGKLQLCSAPEYAQAIVKTLEQRKPPMISAAALETLSIVAYYQPVTRAVIEKMRGVDSSYTVSSLLERGLIEACGRLEAPGRPTQYATSDAFLRVMGIRSLSELPPLPEVQGSEGAEQLRRSIARLQDAEPAQQTMFEEENNEPMGE